MKNPAEEQHVHLILTKYQEWNKVNFVGEQVPQSQRQFKLFQTRFVEGSKRAFWKYKLSHNAAVTILAA